MEVITKEIERAIEAGFVYVAVAMCLSLPDVCSALESENGESKTQNYMAWYERWMGEDYQLFLSGRDMWSLRCGVLHQGRLGNKKFPYDRILFMLTPGFHQCMSDGTGESSERVFQLDARQFCKDMLDAVSRWHAAKQNDPHVVRNTPRLVSFRPDGYPPHFVGMPVIG